jgi:hypothetical protein
MEGSLREIPDHPLLLRAYPNPFNPATRIRFRVPEPGGKRLSGVHVTLAVFDLQGRLVRNVVEALLEPGVHEAEFDGSDLASGLYICRLSVGGTSVSTIAVLAR